MIRARGIRSSDSDIGKTDSGRRRREDYPHAEGKSEKGSRSMTATKMFAVDYPGAQSSDYSA